MGIYTTVHHEGTESLTEIERDVLKIAGDRYRNRSHR